MSLILLVILYLFDFIGFLFATNYPHEVASKGGRDLYRFFQRLIFPPMG